MKRSTQNWIIGLSSTAGVCVLACALRMLWPTYPEDNIYEEKLEELIENHTGIDVDLSHCSPEGTPQ